MRAIKKKLSTKKLAIFGQAFKKLTPNVVAVLLARLLMLADIAARFP